MRRRVGRFGWWVLGLLALAAVAVTFAPTLVVPFLAGRLSAATGADVRIGWIDWNPFAGRVVLHRVAVAPDGDAPPLITLGSLTVDVAVRRWLAGERALDALELRRPWIALRRTGPGDFDVARLCPALGASSAPAAGAPEAPAGPPRPWRIGEFRIVSGSVEFRDETIVPVLETSLHLDDATAHQLVFATGGAATIAFHVESRIENEPLELDVSYETAPDSSHVQATLHAVGASLARALLYVPLGWQRTSGTLDATIIYERRVEKDQLRQHGLRAALVLHDLALTEPWTAEPMLRAKRVGVPGAAVDFIKQRTDLGTIQVDDYAALVVRDAKGVHVPLASGSADATPSTWRTTIDRVALGKGTAVLRQLLPGPELTVPLAGGTVALPEDGVRFQLSGALAGGRVDLDGRGTADATVMTFGLRDLALAETPRLLGFPLPFERGRLNGALTLRVADATTLGGELSASDARTVPSAEHPEEVLAWQRLDLKLADTTLDPLHLRIPEATAVWPYVMLHRRPDGWFPLTLAAASATPGAPAGPSLTIDRLRVDGGRLEFYDTTLPQAYGIDLVDLSAEISGIALAPFSVAQVALHGALDELSPFDVRGSWSPERADFTASVDRLLLPPLNPYLAPTLGYAVKSGLGRIATEVRIAGKDLAADNDVTLSRFAMRAVGPDMVEQQIGTPLSVALAMMKDTHGDVHLELPIRGDLAANEFRVGNLVREALGNALLGTLRRPLGFLRGIFTKDEGERFDLQPVPFAAGTAELGADGEARIADIARLLGRQTALHAVLMPEASRADADALGGDAARLAALGRARSALVANRLTTQHGIDPQRVGVDAADARAPDIEGEPGVDVQLRID